MTLRLTEEDLRRFGEAQRALLSPLAYEHASEWGHASMEAVARLFGGDRNLFFLPHDEAVLVFSDDPTHGIAEAMAPFVKGMEPGANRYACPQMDEALDRRRRAGIHAWSSAMVTRLDGRPIESSLIYHEIIVPTSMRDPCALTHPLPMGEAQLGIAYSRDDLGPFQREELGVPLLELLLPAFQAGIDLVVEMDHRRTTLSATLDHVTSALLIADGEGREVHRNHGLRTLLEEDPRGEEVARSMSRLARETARAGRRGKAGEPRPLALGSGDHQTPSARYSFRAGFLAPGVLGRADLILISLKQETPRLPSLQRLEERYRLTAREAEVALHMARGLSNVEIARRMGISRHTVRHHGEHVFGKLDVRTRKALGLKLLDEPSTRR